MKRLILATAGLLLAGSALAGGNHPNSSYAHYPTYAGQEMSELKFTRLHDYQRLTDTELLLWTKPSQAYLLTLAANCYELRGRPTVAVYAVDGIHGRLRAGTGDLLVNDLRCRVVSIQPIDMAALKNAKS